MLTDIEAYYRSYKPMVLSRCRCMLQDEELALDAMQDTFVRLLKHRDHLEPTALSSLLCTIATRICLNQLRRKRDLIRVLKEDAVADGRQDGSPEERVASVDQLRYLFADQRASTLKIAVLNLVEGFTQQETAAEVGMSVSGIRRRLHRMKRSMEASWQRAARE